MKNWNEYLAEAVKCCNKNVIEEAPERKNLYAMFFDDAGFEHLCDMWDRNYELVYVDEQYIPFLDFGDADDGDADELQAQLEALEKRVGGKYEMVASFMDEAIMKCDQDIVFDELKQNHLSKDEKGLRKLLNEYKPESISGKCELTHKMGYVVPVLFAKK